MQNAIMRGFANVFRFRGRDTRSEFWPYAGAAFALYMVVGWAVTIPMSLSLLDHPITSTDFEASQEMRFLWACFLVIIFLKMLLAAAVARRLHDSGRTAFWGLLPLPFGAYCGMMFLRFFSQIETGGPGEPGLWLFLALLVGNLLYFVSMIWLIVLLALRGTPGPSRFG
jgi:uncharacterized membrane protein YhaH (DUF805 family)